MTARSILMITVGFALTLGGCATHCERDTPNLAQPDYDGIATAQGGCAPGAARPVRSAELQDHVPA